MCSKDDGRAMVKDTFTSGDGIYPGRLVRWKDADWCHLNLGIPSESMGRVTGRKWVVLAFLLFPGNLAPIQDVHSSFKFVCCRSPLGQCHANKT